MKRNPGSIRYLKKVNKLCTDPKDCMYNVDNERAQGFTSIFLKHTSNRFVCIFNPNLLVFP